MCLPRKFLSKTIRKFLLPVQVEFRQDNWSNAIATGLLWQVKKIVLVSIKTNENKQWIQEA